MSSADHAGKSEAELGVPGLRMVGDRDVDGDGRPDAIVGTSGPAAAEGVAYLLLGW